MSLPTSQKIDRKRHANRFIWGICILVSCIEAMIVYIVGMELANAGRTGIRQPYQDYMSQFTIKPAVEADVPALLTLIRELAEFERLLHEVKATADDLHAAMFGERPVAAALLARAGDEVVGYAIYYRTFSTFVGRPGIYLEDLYVRPPFRSRGLGRAMLEALAAVSVELGGGRLEWAALDWNENALRFYRSLGAKVRDEWVLLRMDGDDVGKFLGTEQTKRLS